VLNDIDVMMMMMMMMMMSNLKIGAANS